MLALVSDVSVFLGSDVLACGWGGLGLACGLGVDFDVLACSMILRISCSTASASARGAEYAQSSNQPVNRTVKISAVRILEFHFFKSDRHEVRNCKTSATKKAQLEKFPVRGWYHIYTVNEPVNACLYILHILRCHCNACRHIIYIVLQLCNSPLIGYQFGNFCFLIHPLPVAIYTLSHSKPSWAGCIPACS